MIKEPDRALTIMTQAAPRLLDADWSVGFDAGLCIPAGEDAVGTRDRVGRASTDAVKPGGRRRHVHPARRHPSHVGHGADPEPGVVLIGRNDEMPFHDTEILRLQQLMTTIDTVLDGLRMFDHETNLMAADAPSVTADAAEVPVALRRDLVRLQAAAAQVVPEPSHHATFAEQIRVPVDVRYIDRGHRPIEQLRLPCRGLEPIQPPDVDQCRCGDRLLVIGVGDFDDGHRRRPGLAARRSSRRSPGSRTRRRRTAAIVRQRARTLPRGPNTSTSSPVATDAAHAAPGPCAMHHDIEVESAGLGIEIADRVPTTDPTAVTVTDVHDDVLPRQRHEGRERLAGDGDAAHPRTDVDHVGNGEQVRARGRELSHTHDPVRAGQLAEIQPSPDNTALTVAGGTAAV